jgi:phenylpropionate dioxygenase-like ring-hydroxylating dioxygenase large terminal subunit
MSAAMTAVAGEALDPRMYLDESLVELEQERIFERTWQLMGHVSTLPRPGSYTTGYAGNQPVLVVRDEAGRLNAYRNVCRDRASCLLTGSGQLSRREDAVAWFADRVRADLAEVPTE